MAIAALRAARADEDNRRIIYGPEYRLPGNLLRLKTGGWVQTKSTGDSKGGRLATSFQGDLTKSNSAWGTMPTRLTFSGEGKWYGPETVYTRYVANELVGEWRIDVGDCTRTRLPGERSSDTRPVKWPLSLYACLDRV